MDPIADMIVRLKNASLAGREVVSVPRSKIKLAIAEKLKSRGFVRDVVTRGKKTDKTIELVLARASDGSFRISDTKRISKPGCRVYYSSTDIMPVRGGSGVVVLSTPRGVLFGDEARKEHVGGEALFELW